MFLSMLTLSLLVYDLPCRHTVTALNNTQNPRTQLDWYHLVILAKVNAGRYLGSESRWRSVFKKSSTLTELLDVKIFISFKSHVLTSTLFIHSISIDDIF